MGRTADWTFPLPRTHTGMLLGNAITGAMIWGEGGVLRITLGRADFWDHRGGLEWTEAMSYANIRDCLERNDRAGLDRLFHNAPPPAGLPARPTVLPLGRIELDFGTGAQLVRGRLDLDAGVVTVTLDRNGTAERVRLVQDMEAESLVAVDWDGPGPERVRRVPSWRYVGETLAAVGFQPPQNFGRGEHLGWVQERPADPPLCLAVGRREDGLALTAVYGETPKDARTRAKDVVTAADAAFDAVRRRARQWWRAYWRRVPEVRLPHAELQHLYDYGMYKFAGLTRPGGVPATLQGPWIEETQLPPWSSDYHFNINVQMCYWPAYHGGCLEHLLPIFELVHSWTETLRQNARLFIGVEDGRMLPHAVDDRCVVMGGFWTGTLDHGCTAWVAQMMYRYVCYTGDLDFLKRVAYPFMAGTMRVYEAMLEERDGGLVLPLSVSPEYRGAAMNAWGANASFQLACIHRLAEDLQAAAADLGETPDPAWARIHDALPRATCIGPDGQERIALWEGTPLEESHRHHSHLAGIVPFDILGFEDPDWRPVLERSFADWIRRGPGLWSGWCIPWASMLHTRAGNADAAVLWLEIWKRLFTNEGGGTLHDAAFSGFSLTGAGPVGGPDLDHEKMQMDAGMSALTALQEFCVQERRGVVHLFAGAPAAWADCSFARMAVAGGFRLSAERADGAVATVTVTAERTGTLRLANPWDGPAHAEGKGHRTRRLTGPVLELPLAAGDTLTLRPARN